MAGVETGSNRDLWQFIAGATVLRPKELVGLEITRNKTKLSHGLTHYKRQTTPSGEGLSDAGLTLQGPKLELITKLSKFLTLDEKQAYGLFRSYLLHEFQGSQKDLQNILGDDRHSQGLVLKIRDYYFSERLYLLRCLKHILSYWQDTNHPYKDEYATFFEASNINDELINNIILQYEEICEVVPPTRETHGTLMNERQMLCWVRQNLSEQCELLELILLYYKDFELSAERLANMAMQYKKQGFGQRQTYKHLLDDSMEPLLLRIGYLQVLILVEGMDIEFLYRCHDSDNIDEHHIFKDKKHFKKLDTLMCNLVDNICHGPLVMMWALVRHITMESQQAVVTVTRRLGNTALQLKVFHYLLAMLNTEPFSGKTMIAGISQFIIYGLLTVMLNIFHEETLGDTDSLYQVTALVLQQPLIAEDFWDKSLTEGVGMLLQSALARFPLDFEPLMVVTTALAKASKFSAKKVVQLLQQLPYYFELFDENQAKDIKQTSEEMVWKLVQDKKPYRSDVFVIPSGSYGELQASQDKQIPLIRWEGVFNGWKLLLGEVLSLLQRISYGAGSVSSQSVARVVGIMKLVNAILKMDNSQINEVQPTIEQCFHVIHRFAVVSPPHLDLLSSCLDVLATVVSIKHQYVWHNLLQTGLLPFMTENLDNLQEAASGSGLQTGHYGLMLASAECPSGQYVVTEAILDIASNIIEPMRTSGRQSELMATILFILREIFPVFQKWRYADFTKREVLGQKCLEIFHKILDISEDSKNRETTVPQSLGSQHKVTLREVSVHVLLYTEAGRALLDIISTGSDIIEQALAQQGSAQEGLGIELIHLIRLAFSVLNRLLLLRPSDQSPSPVEHALSAQPAGHQHRHVVAMIAQYIYHRHDPRLATLATLLLKRLAMISPMSILACLGNDAPAVRDMYLTRLQSYTEDTRLKVVTLELLAVCVETQPGLIEMFLNVQQDDKPGSKDLLVGETSCLQSTLELINEKKQGTYHCPPALLCAASEFIHALWCGRRETAMAVLREKKTFWPCLFGPLLRDLPVTSADEDQAARYNDIRTSSYVLKILALELYGVQHNKLDTNLKASLDKFMKKKRLEFWSQFVRDLVKQEGDISVLKEEVLMENSILRLLTAWKSFCMVIANQRIDVLNIKADTKATILQDILDGLQIQFQSSSSILQMKLASVSSALYLTVLKYWKGHIKNWSEVLIQLSSILHLTCANSETLIPSVQIGIIGAVTTVVQHIRKENLQGTLVLGTSFHGPYEYVLLYSDFEGATVDISQLCSGLNTDIITSLFPVTCSVLQQNTYQLLPPSSSKQELDSRGEQGIAQIDVKLKLQLVSTCLVEELIMAIDGPLLWLPVVQQHSLLQSLLSSVEAWIGARRGLHYVQAVLLLFLTMCKYPEAAETLAVCGFTQHTCLPLMAIYKPEDFTENVLTGMSARTTSRRSHSSVSLPVLHESQTWAGIYRLAIRLYTAMLSTLKYSFLQDALNFVGVHQDRMIWCLERVKVTLSPSAMLEAKESCSFLFTLSHYSREWQLHMRDNMNKLLTSICFLSQACVALLIRPRLLDHMLERHMGSETAQHSSTSNQNLLMHSVSHTLQTQTSTEDIDLPSPELEQAQHRLLEILAHCLATLRQFSPDLSQIMLDQSMDISQFEPFLEINFSTPSIDQDVLPSFGTLISCANLCLKHLTKVDPRSTSPLKSPRSGSEDGLITKSLILFVLENSLHLVMSQAMRYLKESSLPTRDKQLLKRELGAELSQFLSSLLRYLRRGSPQSPSSSLLPSPVPSATHVHKTASQTTFSTVQEQAFFRLVDNFVKQVLR